MKVPKPRFFSKMAMTILCAIKVKRALNIAIYHAIKVLGAIFFTIRVQQAVEVASVDAKKAIVDAIVDVILCAIKVKQAFNDTGCYAIKVKRAILCTSCVQLAVEGAFIDAI
jgi:hypothetical protein